LYFIINITIDFVSIYLYLSIKNKFNPNAFPDVFSSCLNQNAQNLSSHSQNLSPNTKFGKGNLIGSQARSIKNVHYNLSPPTLENKYKFTDRNIVVGKFRTVVSFTKIVQPKDDSAKDQFVIVQLKKMLIFKKGFGRKNYFKTLVMIKS
jgi:hypothetical protein